VYEYIKGVLETKKTEYVALDVNGVGYMVHISLKTYDKLKLGAQEKLYIYTYVKEDSFKLIGFYDERERDMFKLLLNVNGIGISLALAILSAFDVSDLKKAIVNGDINLLIKVPKLGKKKAEKLIVDLRDKVGGLSIFDVVDAGDADEKLRLEEDLYLALESLGYSKKEISSIVRKEDIDGYRDIEEAVKGVLKKIQIMK
jgi:Holliday junction DNA helicase RuvA